MRLFDVSLSLQRFVSSYISLLTVQLLIDHLKNAVDTHPWNQLLEWIVASDLKALKMMVDTGVAYYFTIYSLEVFVQWKCTTVSVSHDLHTCFKSSLILYSNIIGF